MEGGTGCLGRKNSIEDSMVRIVNMQVLIETIRMDEDY